MKYHLFKKFAALGMAASVSLSAIAPAFAADDSGEELVAEAENTDSDNSDDETSNDGEQTPADGDTSNDEQAPSNEDTSKEEDSPSNEDTSDDDEEQNPSNENTSNKEETPSNENTSNDNLEEEKTSETPTVKPDGYGEVTQAGGKGNSLVTLEIVNDGSSNPGGGGEDPDNPGGGGEDPDNPGGGGEDPDNPGGGGEDPDNSGGGGEDPDNPGGGGEDPDNPGGGGDDPEPMIFSAYVPSVLPMKLTEDGTVLTPSKAAIINGVATKGIVVKDIEAHLDYDWDAEDWDADYSSMPVNTKNVGLKLREDTLSKNGDFSVNAEDWKIPKDSYIDLNMKAKLPPQKIETVTQNSDVARLSFTLDWSGDDTTTGPKWEGGAINPDNPNDNPSTLSKPKIESSDTIVSGGNGFVKVTWDDKDGKITLDRIISSNTDIATVGDITGSDGNKTVVVNGLKGGTSTITVTLSNGETATYEVTVYEVGNPDDIKVTVSNKELGVGDSVTSNDVIASVPLIAPDGSIKTITVKPSVDDNTLQAGRNSLTGTVTVGGQDYPIHFDITVENPDSNKSGIKAESNDTFIAGETGNIKFNWNTKDNSITLTGITSSDESIATVDTITGEEGSKTVTINALDYGTTSITATLSNGETATFEAKVYKVGNGNDIQVTVNNPNLGVGDKLTSDDVTVKVPIISPDGETIFIERTPSIEDNTLKVGDNTITGTVTVGKSTYNITVTITVEQTSIPISVTSTTYIVGNESNTINFQWDIKDGSITLSNVTSSNAEVAGIKTTTGDEGDKTVGLDCLKAGTTNIELTFSNGSTASCEIIVYEVGNLDDTEVIITDKEFNAGDTLSSEDVTIRVPLVDGEGNIKTVDMSVDFEDTTLKPGTNHFTVNLTIGGQTHTVSFDISTEIPENMKSGIKAESTDVLVAGGTGNVVFNWNTRDDTISLTGVTSNNTNVASIGTTTGIEGNKTTTINALKGGTSTITAALSNGETVSIDLPVYVVDTTKEMQVEVADKKYNVGDKLTSSDVTVKVPLTAPDGSTKYIDVHPSVENKALVMGDNTLTGTVTVGNNSYNINITIIIENPSNGLVMSVPEAQAMGFTFASYQDGLEITGFENKMFKSTINVPAQIGDFEVLRIGDNAFEGQSNLKAINLPDSVVELGERSFMECVNLNDIIITGKLTKIGPRVFLNCTRLENVALNLDANCTMEEINESRIRINGGFETGKLTITPFMGCTSLKNVIIKSDGTSLPPLFTTKLLYPVSVTLSGHKDTTLSLIGSYDESVNGKYYLRDCHFNVTLDCNNLTNIPKHMFANSGITTINMPNSVKSIGIGSFVGCSSLTNIDLSGNITMIEGDAFSGCTGLTNIILPNNIMSIGVNAFRDCKNLTNIIIPGSIQNIDSYMFDGCSNLERVIIKEGIKRIANGAFRSCTKLKEIDIPSSVTTIDDNVFQYIYNNDLQINVNRRSNTISGAPWGATNATVKWKN